ncbi:unnamed protein product, partial [Prorocentrum cordatum]
MDTFEERLSGHGCAMRQRDHWQSGPFWPPMSILIRAGARPLRVSTSSPKDQPPPRGLWSAWAPSAEEAHGTQPRRPPTSAPPAGRPPGAQASPESPRHRAGARPTAPGDEPARRARHP